MVRGYAPSERSYRDETCSPIRSLVGQHGIRVVLILIAACLYVFLSTRIGLDAYTGGPDEGMRSLIPRCIINGNLFPSGYDECATYHLGYWSYAFYPQVLASYLSAFFMAVARLLGCSDSLVFVSGRFASVCFGVVALCAVGSSVSLAFRGHRHREMLACLAIVLLGFWPQFAFLSSYMNNDIAALAGVSLLLLALIRGFKLGWSPAAALLLCAGVAVAGLGYWNAYGFILVSVVLFIVTVLRQYAADRRKAIRLIVGAAAVCAVCVLPFFLANLTRYGDIVGMRVFRERYMQWIADGGERLQHPWTGGLRALLSDSEFVQWTTESFIGVFGYMASWMPYAVYLLYIILASAGIGLFLARCRDYAGNPRAILLTAGTMVASVITVVLFFYYNLSVDYQPQGRYIIYLLIPLVIVSVFGVGRSFTFDRSASRIIVALFMVAYVMLCLWCFRHAITTGGWNGVHWESEGVPL